MDSLLIAMLERAISANRAYVEMTPEREAHVAKLEDELQRLKNVQHIINELDKLLAE